MFQPFKQKVDLDLELTSTDARSSVLEAAEYKEQLCCVVCCVTLDTE